ncbi:MAG TPA: hypothetical protein PKL84_18150 [Candidatus Hydrogenedentes bacterium]|nr:hypothetical protein [Candidatus Hydrogenedentota bacterium]
MTGPAKCVCPNALRAPIVQPINPAYSSGFWVQCNMCGRRGPDAKDRQAAIDEWDRDMRARKWLDGKPT